MLGTAAPHEEQNFAPSRSSAPHCSQFIMGYCPFEAHHTGALVVRSELCPHLKWASTSERSRRT